jgi:hypothetical protein
MGYLGTNKLTKNMIMHPGDYLLSSDGSYQLTMQSNGNLTLGANGQTSTPPAWRWQSGTAGNNNATCEMYPSGDLIIMASDGTKIYHSGTSGNTNAYLIVASDVQILTSSGNPLNPPWDNGGMYPYPSFAPTLVVSQLRESVTLLQNQVTTAQNLLSHLEEALRSPDPMAALAAVERPSRNGDPRYHVPHAQ